MSSEYQKQYLYPPDEVWVILSVASVATFETVRIAVYLAIATQLRAFFAPPASAAAPAALPSGTALAVQGAAAAASLQSCTIQVRFSEDGEKAGAKPDWKGGTSKNISYSILSSLFKLVLSKARSSRAAMF